MLNIFFPKVCSGCQDKLLKAENVLCTQCRQDLPLACHHRNGDHSMEAVFYGRVAVENATALLRFSKKGLTQELLHNLKYRGQEQIGRFFGTWLGSELSELDAYQNIDCIIPVPIHGLKKRKRGYNQVTGFGAKISEALEKPMYEDVLVKNLKTSSQVFKQRLTRFGNTEVFAIADRTKIEGKHLLVVDDIVTTGATLENCANQLLNAGASKVSFATIAIA